MRTITNAELIEANISAFYDGRLCAQNDLGALYRAVNKAGRTCGCAIGVALTEDEINAIITEHKNGNGVSSILNIVRFEDMMFVHSLQHAHDYWTGEEGVDDAAGAKDYRALLGV